VDSVGSVTFGGPPGRRLIPGVGAGVAPRQLDERYVDDVVSVHEVDTIRACRRLARRGFLFGGSTGTVVSGALDWLNRNDARQLTAVAISPDLGERYLDTIYDDGWVRENYDDDVLASDESPADLGRPDRCDHAQSRPAVNEHAGLVRHRHRRSPGRRVPIA
jgi:N-(2-amino-2-carboxyethyl)-L-glutamate synthase